MIELTRDSGASGDNLKVYHFHEATHLRNSIDAHMPN